MRLRKSTRFSNIITWAAFIISVVLLAQGFSRQTNLFLAFTAFLLAVGGVREALGKTTRVGEPVSLAGKLLFLVFLIFLR